MWWNILVSRWVKKLQAGENHQKRRQYIDFISRTKDSNSTVKLNNNTKQWAQGSGIRGSGGMRDAEIFLSRKVKDTDRLMAGSGLETRRRRELDRERLSLRARDNERVGVRQLQTSTVPQQYRKYRFLSGELCLQRHNKTMTMTRHFL